MYGVFDDNWLGRAYDDENRLILLYNVDPLAAACDVDLAFTTYGDAAQSGAIGASEETWLQTTVIG